MNRNKPAPGDLKALYTQKYNISRGNLLLVVAITLINIVMADLGSDTYFLFSAILPYSLALFGALWTGKLPEEYYTPDQWPENTPFSPDSVLYSMVAVAVVILALYFVCWIFSKNLRSGWLIGATVLFGIDTLYMLLIYGVGIDSVMDILFHAWVLYYLISGIIYGNKLKKLPPEQEVTEDNTEIPLPSEENK